MVWDCVPLQMASIFVIEYVAASTYLRPSLRAVEKTGFLTERDAERCLNRQYHNQQANENEAWQRKTGLWVPTHECHPEPLDRRFFPVVGFTGEAR